VKVPPMSIPRREVIAKAIIRAGAGAANSLSEFQPSRRVRLLLGRPPVLPFQWRSARLFQGMCICVGVSSRLTVDYLGPWHLSSQES